VASAKEPKRSTHFSQELVHLVAWDGNHPLDTASDEEAADFLKQFATMARNILAETKD
jgi:hypothetical protein